MCVISSLCSVLQVNGGIEEQLKKEILQYDYHNSFFDIFVSLNQFFFFFFSSELHLYLLCDAVLKFHIFSLYVLAYLEWIRFRQNLLIG